MHKDFAEWYRSAGITPDGETLLKRWAAIAAFEVDRSDVASLTRLFYRLGTPKEDFLKAFRAEFQKADAAFPMRGNDHELAVLAGAELVDTIERSSAPLADLAALCLVCAAAQQLRPTPAVSAIPETASRFLSSRATKRSQVDEGSSEGTLLKALTDLGSPYDKLAIEFHKLQSELSIVTEEANMLWWLLSEFSRDLNTPWRKLPAPAVPLIAGKELADLTRVIPGPIAAAAFLDRTIRSGRTKPPTLILTIAAVNETPVDWRLEYIKDSFPDEIEVIAPISYAVKLSLIAPENDEWVPMFTSATGIASNSKIAPHTLAYQLFLEGLLRRSFAAAK